MEKDLEDKAQFISWPGGTPKFPRVLPTVFRLWTNHSKALLPKSLQLYPNLLKTEEGAAAGGPDGPGWARAPGIPVASAGSRTGRKPAPAASPRILWAAQPGRTEALFVPAPTRHPAGPGF